MTITAGDSILWTNLQAGFHNVVQMDNPANCASITSGGFNSGIAGSVNTFTYQFTVVGTFDYECQTHCAGGMKGVVVVQ